MTAVKLFQSIIQKLPMRFFYGVSDLLYLIGYKIFSYRLTVVRKNIEAAFPHKTQAEHRQIEKDFFRHLSDYLVETAALAKLSPEEMQARIKFNNLALLEEYQRNNKKVMLATGHQSNWEWMAYLPQLTQQKVTAVYRKQSSGFSDEIIYQNRSKFGMNLVKDKELMPYLKQLDKDKSHILYMLSDQRPLGKRSGVLKFMHQPVNVFQGLNFINRMFDYDVIYGEFKKTSRGHYEITFKKIERQTGESYVDAFFRMLEQSIEAQPYTYLWSHNRWKNPPQMPEEKIKPEA